MADFSVSRFRRVFTATVGESPTAYIHRMRLERAGRKLRMGTVDIGEVALAAGYDTHTAFSKAFKQHFDLAPTKRSATSAVRQLLHKFGHNFNTTLPKLAKQNKCSIIL